MTILLHCDNGISSRSSGLKNWVQYNIMVIETLTTECQTTVHLTIGTVFDNDIRVRTIIGILIRPCTLAALQYYGIIIDMHVTAMNQHVPTDIEVDGIRAGAATFRVDWRHIFRRRKDETSQIAHVLAAVEVVGPE